MTDELTLAAEFPTPTREDWLALVDKVLKGGDFHKKLVTRTADGIEIQPLYTAEDSRSDAEAGPDHSGFPGTDPFTRGRAAAPRPNGAWDVRVVVDHPDATEANRLLLDELLRGATSLSIRIGGEHGSGVRVASADDLDRLLDGVYLDLAPVALDPGPSFRAPAQWLSEVWSRRGVGGAEVTGSLGADPLGSLALFGSIEGGIDQAMTAAAALAASTAAATPNVAALSIDAGIHLEAGGTPGQQLAGLLATGVAYLRACETAGLDATTAASQIEARLVVDADFFGGIALCRAARRVWAALLAECGVAEDGRGLRLQVRTADRMMTVRDPWVNLLRVTSATFAAALGGADGVLALPFDRELGVPDEFGRRLARNTNLLLQEESNVGRVLDPAGGSWFVEALTEQLATVAWDLFAGIEASGGMAAVLADGSWKERIDAAAKVRHEAIAHRKVPITGVSEFPFLDEKPVVRDPMAESERDAAWPDAALRPVRDAEWGYESLRNMSDTYRDAHGHRPQVFLANLGPVAVHTTRSMWAKNFFEAGGIEALGNDGFTDPEAAGAAFAASGARIACICGSDTIYGELAETTAKALVAAGARRIYLAGNPGDARAGYEAAGVSEFVHVGVNVIQALAQAHGTIADEENDR